MDGWVIFLIIILVILIIFVIIFLVWFFSHNDKLGQTCTMQSECGAGLVCVNTGTIPAPAYTCRAGFHSPCTGGSTSTQCAPGLTCGSNSTCIPIPSTPPPPTGQNTNGRGPRPTPTPVQTQGQHPGHNPNPARNRPGWTGPRQQGVPPHNPRPQPDQRPAPNSPHPGSYLHQHGGQHEYDPIPPHTSAPPTIVPNTAPTGHVPHPGSYLHSHPSSNSSSNINSDPSPNPVRHATPAPVVASGHPIVSRAVASSANVNDESGIESSISSDTVGEGGCLDMCSFSDMTLALYGDGRIVAQPQGTASRYVNNNVRLRRIFSYNRYLTGLTVEGIIVWLDQDQIDKDTWIWKRYANMPEQITSCSVTLNQEYMWLHDATRRRGYLYNGITMIEEISHYSFRRVYGLDNLVYVEIDEQKKTATVHPTGQVLTDVYDVAVSHPDKVAVLRLDQLDAYRGIAIVNWEAMYIKV